ncbi:hypothetical protein [Corynebacterium appendicis]|uniref:hypothetical protein n=1 Tax=Corynebacterium appendicis TaxID=163202 RepID=UPI00254FE3DA|nr:hypothetical protein [Corynebacterium appendicis]MDK8626214.1 hypothetical protein [Corynebacterium appendicis]
MTLFVKTIFTAPDGSGLVNVAELAELDDTRTNCRMVRMIELTPDHSIVGAFTDGKVHGSANTPLDVVPHPDKLGQFDDIEHHMLEQGEFDGLWAEAQTLFPDLPDRK